VLAHELAARTGRPVIGLDEFWQPGWVVAEDAWWRSVQQQLVASPTWILDGVSATARCGPPGPCVALASWGAHRLENALTGLRAEVTAVRLAGGREVRR